MKPFSLGSSTPSSSHSRDSEPTTAAPKRAASVSPETLWKTSDSSDIIYGSLTPSPSLPAVFDSSPPPSPSASKGRAIRSNTANSTGTRPSAMKRIRSETETSSKTGSYVSFSLPASAPFEDEPMERLVYSDIEDEDTYSNDGDGDLSGDWNPESKFRASPKKRRPSKSSVSSRTKELAKARDPNGGICLLTNARKPVVSRQFCHLLARRTTHETLTNLEWKLQMPYWTLNIDTSFNVFALVANWHLAMDDDHWTLMPHHKIISRILEWANNTIKDDPTGYNKDNRTPISESKLYKGKTKFTYYFLALSDDMKDVAITRYNKDFDPKAVENHLHPFSTIGALISHVHPHFVIYSAGDKLAKIEATKRVDEGAWLETLAETASFGHKGDSIAKENLRSLQEIMDIHKLWSSDEDVPQKTDDPRHEWMRHPKELL